jgi:hypothetical protein
LVSPAAFQTIDRTACRLHCSESSRKYPCISIQ